MNRTLKTAEVAVLALIAVAGFLFTACSGDMHDEDESTRAAIIISLQDQTVTLPSGTDFYQDWWISNTTGTYGELSFTSAKITIDSANPTSRMELVLNDGSSKKIYNTSSKTGCFTLEEEMTFCTKGAAVSSLDFNGLKQAK